MKVEEKYLTDIPQEIESFGFCKILVVRYDVIHIKHILTEIFVRKTIDIEQLLSKINWSLFRYMEHITNRLRRIHHFSREYKNNLNNIVKSDRDNFFPTIELYSGLNNVIILDFDGVVTENNFHELYKLCLERCKTVVCSANPMIKEDWFQKRELHLPSEIYACKGKKSKINRLIELSEKYDHVFYIDNEEDYLQYAWIFGMSTFKWENNKIRFYTMKTK